MGLRVQRWNERVHETDLSLPVRGGGNVSPLYGQKEGWNGRDAKSLKTGDGLVDQGIGADIAALYHDGA